MNTITRGLVVGLLGWVGLGATLTRMAAQTTRPAAGAVAPQEEAEVIGVEVARASGGFLGVAIEGNALVVRFYDDKREPVRMNVTRAAAHWNPPRQARRERTVLNPVDAETLRSPAVVRPPHTFFAVVTLLDDAGNAVETHSLDMRAQE